MEYQKLERQVLEGHVKRLRLNRAGGNPQKENLLVVVKASGRRIIGPILT
jgi:hypothetical protein